MKTKILALTIIPLWLFSSQVMFFSNVGDGIPLGQSATATPTTSDFQEIERLHGEAILAFNRGDLQQSLDLLKIAEQLAIQLDDIEWQIEIQGSIGWVNIISGNIPGAIPILERAVSLTTQTSNVHFSPWLNRMLGSLYQDIGEYQQALEYYLLAHDQYRAILSNPPGPIEPRRDPATEFRRSLGDLGAIYALLKEYDRSSEYFVILREESKEAGDITGQASAIHNLGFISHKLGGDLEKILDTYYQIFDLGIELIDMDMATAVVNNIATLHIELGDYDLASDMLLALLSIHKEQGDIRSQILILNNLGFNETQRKRYDAAEMYYKEVIEKAEEHGFNDLLVAALGTVAFLKEEQGETDLALEKFLEVIDIIEAYKDKITVPSIASQYSSMYLENYQHAVRLLISQGFVEEAFNLTESYRANILLDTLSALPLISGQIDDPDLVERYFLLATKISSIDDDLSHELSKPVDEIDLFRVQELEDGLSVAQEEYEILLDRLSFHTSGQVISAYIQPVSYEELRQLIPSDETFVSYFFTNDDIVAFIITADQIDVITLDYPPQAVFDEIWDFTELGLFTFDNLFSEPLSNLSTWLIEPILDRISTKKLGIIPHLDLHYLPFSALPVGDGYLGDQFWVFELPSASFLPLLHDAEGRDQDDDYQSAVFGNPDVSSFGLTPLEYAENEALAISDLLGVTPYMGNEATEANLRLIAPEIDLLHIAAHGEWRPDAPLFSRIWLTEGDGYDGQLNVYEVFDLGISSADLIVLSACETGVGYVNDADQAINLARAFLPGARSLISTLWQVDDEATAFLFTQFYTYLRDGLEKAEALSLAQRDVRENEEHLEWQHPYFWGAFILYGDPGASSIPVGTQLFTEIGDLELAETSNLPTNLINGAVGGFLIILVFFSALAWRKKTRKPLD